MENHQRRSILPIEGDLEIPENFWQPTCHALNFPVVSFGLSDYALNEWSSFNSPPAYLLPHNKTAIDANGNRIAYTQFSPVPIGTFNSENAWGETALKKDANRDLWG